MNSAALSCPAGDLLIIMAQIIVSVQMVLEEKFVYKHDVHPLRAVGTEGTALSYLLFQVTCFLLFTLLQDLRSCWDG